MRIALITETFLPKTDGIVNTLRYLLEHLARHRHDSILLCPDGAPAYYADTPIAAFDALPFPLYPQLRLAPPSLDAMKALRRFKPDLIHVLNPISLGLSGVGFAHLHRVPLVASYHTDLPGFAQRWGWGIFSGTIARYERMIHDQAALNLCPSWSVLMELRSRGFERLKIWSRGVDRNRFSPDYRSEAMRMRLTGGSPGPLLLSVGRLSREKRLHWLRPILDRHPDCALAIVGDGPARGELERHFRGTRTVFTGMLHGDELASAYASADLFLLPAANETFGNVGLEAMSSGLPVVAAASGGPLDFVHHGRNGLLFAPENETEFASRVQAILYNPALQGQLRDGALRTAQGRSWQSVLDRLLADYEGTILRHTHTVHRHTA
jgi:glycosyltransferase involved in cell wall biosynthesis